MIYDAVIVGAGMAGLSATLRLAQAGRRVLCVAKGLGALNLSPATIDVLGYAPGPVTRPDEALQGFIEDSSDHPYARIGVQSIHDSLDWFKRALPAPRYVGDLSRNFLLPTAVGAAKPSAMLPQTMASGDTSLGGHILLVGIHSYKDFWPALAAANLSAHQEGGVEAEATVIDVPTGGEADAGSLGLARSFEQLEFRTEVAKRVGERLDGATAVGFPAVLGLRNSDRVWEELESRLERPVFEIPTPPPSVPGMRLFRAFKAAISQAGGRVVVGPSVTGAEVSGGRVRALVGEASLRPVRYETRTAVLATGGWASGGLVMDSHRNVNEPVFDLPVAGAPEPAKLLFAPGYFESQPLARSGIAVDDGLRPIDEAGRPVIDNLYVAGAMLAGAEPWREKSGDGISLSSGYKIAGAILAEEAS
ncbi:MAG: glycerol-3-phosphate dehydrogenase subunit GlpB [Actinomycetota bacterium]